MNHKKMNVKIAKLLLKMGNADQAMRSSGKIERKLDRANANKLKRIIAELGWPDYDSVGKEASAAAWLIAQHSDFDIDFQKGCLKEMRKAVRRGKADEILLSYLTDRTLVKTSGKQVYGTQWRLDEITGKMKPWPMRNRKMAETFRKKLGLPTLDDYGKRIQELQDKIQKKAAK